MGLYPKMVKQEELFMEKKGHFEPHVFVSHNAQQTSVEAADKALGRSGNQRHRVYNFIASQGPQGATDDEGMEELGLRGNSYHPRRLELVQAGLVEDSGERRPTVSGNAAIVWRATKEDLTS